MNECETKIIVNKPLSYTYIYNVEQYFQNAPCKITCTTTVYSALPLSSYYGLKIPKWLFRGFLSSSHLRKF